jgi:hypothetical protein
VGCFYKFLSDSDNLWTTQERTDSSTEETIHVSRVHGSLKCHRNVYQQINSLQINNLITNKPVALLEASRRILNTQCVKISVLANVKIFYKHHDFAVLYSTTRPTKSTWWVPFMESYTSH